MEKTIEQFCKINHKKELKSVLEKQLGIRELPNHINALLPARYDTVKITLTFLSNDVLRKALTKD